VAEPAVLMAKRERRVHVRHAVDSLARIDLVRCGLKLSGRILDLSPEGCRLRCDCPYTLGIYTRIEVEFQLEGFPLRLVGVVQAIHDLHTVGIRFLDISARKREQLARLMTEIEEVERMEATGCLPEPSGPVGP